MVETIPDQDANRKFSLHPTNMLWILHNQSEIMHRILIGKSRWIPCKFYILLNRSLSLVFREETEFNNIILQRTKMRKAVLLAMLCITELNCGQKSCPQSIPLLTRGIRSPVSTFLCIR